MMSQTASLKDLQTWLCYTLTDPRGVKNSLNDHQDLEQYRNQRQKPEHSFAETIKNQSPLSNQERLQVYADSYYLRILEMLEANFPILRAQVHDEAFASLTSEFLSINKSQFPTLDSLSLSFVDFIKENLKSSFMTTLATMEYFKILAIFKPLPMVSELENKVSWLGNAHYSNRVTLEFSPSLNYFESDFDLAQLEPQISDSSAEISEIELPKLKQNSFWGVFRNPLTVRLVKFSPLQEQIINFSRQGLPLAEICHKLSGSGADIEAALELGTWLEIGLIHDFRLLETT